MMKFDRLDYTVWVLLGVCGLALAGVIGANSLAGARVARTFPADGGPMDETGRVGLEFAESMQAQTVEPLFETEPPIDGALTWEGQTLWFAPAELLQPGLTYTARLRAGALSQSGRRTQSDVVWQFQARTPWIVYLSPVLGEGSRLWRISSQGGAPQPLTPEGAGVSDFDVSPDGRQIVYSRKNEQGGIDLWLTTGDGRNHQLLVECLDSLCVEPAWSPNGREIAFNRHGGGLTPGTLGPPRVWLVDVASQQAAPLYDDPQIIGASPSWSPDGRRIATLGWLVTDIRLLDRQTGRDTVLPNMMGIMGSWSRDGAEFLYRDMGLYDGRAILSSKVIDLATGQVQQAALDPERYGSPAWSPTGEWLAVTRRNADAANAGLPLWLLDADLREARVVADEPGYAFMGHAWDPWGTALVFTRFKLNTPNATPDIVVWSLADGQSRVLVQDAKMPVWQP